MTLALACVVCATLLILQREVLRYLREYHGTANRITSLEAGVKYLRLATDDLNKSLPDMAQVGVLERRIRDIETLLQAQKLRTR